MNRRRRRWLLVALLAALALLGLGLVVGLRWLEGPAGVELLRQQVLSAAKDALAGRLELGAVALDGERLTLHGVKLFTPEGELVAEVTRVTATVDVRALLRRHVRLTDVEVESPRLLLVQDERGLNLARAVAARAPPTEGERRGGAQPWHLEVRDLELTSGQVELASPTTRLVLAGTTATGFADARLAPLSLEAELFLKGALQQPLSAPVELHLTSASPKPATLETTVTAAVGRSRLAGRFTWPALRLSATELVADPTTVRAFLPDWPLKVPLSAELDVTPGGGTAKARAGTATVVATGTWNLETPAVEAFELSVRELDLAQLLEGGRRSRIAASAKGSLPDARADTLAGSLSATGSWATPDGRTLATASLSASAKGGAVEVRQLAAELPGLTVTGGGRASRSALALRAQAEVTDLSRLSAALAEFTGTQVPLSGNGALELALSGSLERPGVTARGRLGVLRVDSVAADRLDVDVTVPDLTHPLDSDGVLSARRLRLGEQTFEEVSTRVSTQGRHLDAELSMRGLGDLTARIAGELDRGSEGITLSALGLTSPEAEWALEAPTHVAWAGGQLVLEPLALRAGDQRVALQGRKRGARLDGTLELERVELGRLPRVLAPESLGLGGEVGAKASVSGSVSRPEVQGNVTWSRGRVAGLEDLEVSVEGAWRGQRATGKAKVSGPPGTLVADVDLPVGAWLARRDEAWRAHVSASQLDVKALATLARREVPVAAQLAVEADLEGTTNDPRLTLAAETPTLQVEVPRGDETRTLSFERVSATVSTREGGALGVALSGAGFAGRFTADLATPFTLPGLRAAMPTAEALRTTPVRVEAELERVELRQLHEAGLTDDDELAGTGSARATLHGTLRAPRGSLTVSVARAVVHPLRDFDVTATLTADDARTSLELASVVAGRPAFTAQASLAVPIERLEDLDHLGDWPVKATGALNPLELSQVLRGVDGAPSVKGAASASFEVSGTLDAPDVYLGGSVQGLQFSSVPLGSARFTWKGPAKAQRLTLALGGLGREDLKVHGTAGVDLSLAALRRSLDLSSSTLELDVDARGLDLAFLSGATAELRAVGGRLTMRGTVAGTLALPRFEGDAAWSGGRLSLLGLGDYRDIELAVHGTNDLFDLQRLRLRSGAGTASLTATATRARGSQAFHLVAEGTADRFPIVVDDQLVATVSLKTRATGELTDELIDIRSLELPRVDVALPEVKRRDLQDLQRPADIIVVRGGARVSSRARKAAREEALEQKAAGAKPPGRTVRLVVSAPRNLWVRSSDLNVELGLSENFRVERSDKVQIFGEAQVLRGRISVIGREFDVQKSSQLRFAGPARDPYVNVVAIHTNDREKVKVTVTVVGRGTDVTLKTSSDPPMTESDIYTLLATGRRELRRGSGASITPEQAVSVVGNVAAAQLKQVLAKKLPIDVLNFEAGEDFQSVRLDVGKYLSDSVYLGYTFQPGAREDRGENQHAGRLEYQFSRSWAVEAYAGTAPAAGVNVMWSRDF